MAVPAINMDKKFVKRNKPSFNTKRQFNMGRLSFELYHTMKYLLPMNLVNFCWFIAHLFLGGGARHKRISRPQADEGGKMKVRFEPVVDMYKLKCSRINLSYRVSVINSNACKVITYPKSHKKNLTN